MNAFVELTSFHLSLIANPYSELLGRSPLLDKLSGELFDAGGDYLSAVRYRRQQDEEAALARVEQLREEMFAEDRRCRGWEVE